jgi:hypothetical protein
MDGKMEDKQELKDRLPFPYTQDLSQVVRRLNRRKPESRHRLANDPVTAAYLAAAMRLIERHLSPATPRALIDPDDEASVERPLLSFLSQRAVTAEVANNPDPFPRMGSVATMRSTWRSHSDFIADLLSFELWSNSRSAYWESPKVTAAIEQLTRGPDFTRAAHDMGYRYMLLFIDLPRFRLELVAAAASEGDEIIRNAMAGHYRGAVEPWQQLAAEVLQARNLRLRTGITLSDFTTMLAAAAEGMALRAIGDPEADVIDHHRLRSLLGTAGLALILGCMERADGEPDKSLEQAIEAMVYGASGHRASRA